MWTSKLKKSRDRTKKVFLFCLSYLEFSFAKQLFCATFDFTFVFRYPLGEKKNIHINFRSNPFNNEKKNSHTAPTCTSFNERGGSTSVTVSILTGGSLAMLSVDCEKKKKRF